MATVVHPSELAEFPSRGPSRVDFWGYGLEADPAVIEALAQTGEGLYVVGGIKKAIAKDIQLVVQGIDQVPSNDVAGYNPRHVLAKNWAHIGAPFGSYSIAHIEGAITAGTLYVMTNIAIVGALNKWDMVPDWRGRDVVELSTVEGHELNLGPTMTYTARSESPNLPYDRVANGMNYEAHLFGEENTKIAVAKFLWPN